MHNSNNHASENGCHVTYIKGLFHMSALFFPSGMPLQDLIFGAGIYFPPLFKAVFIGVFVWMAAHRLLRDWIYSGEIWHPTLMDLSLFALSVCFGLLLLAIW
jgi:hypothetical protein